MVQGVVRVNKGPCPKELPVSTLFHQCKHSHHPLGGLFQPLCRDLRVSAALCWQHTEGLPAGHTFWEVWRQSVCPATTKLLQSPPPRPQTPPPRSAQLRSGFGAGAGESCSGLSPNRWEWQNRLFW